MHKLFITLLLSLVVAAPAAQANDLERFFDNLGGYSSNDRIQQLRQEKRARQKIANAQGKVAKECSRDNPTRNYYDCEIAKERLRDAEYDASGLGEIFNDRSFGRHHRNNGMNLHKYQRLYEEGRRFGQQLGEELSNGRRPNGRVREYIDLPNCNAVPLEFEGKCFMPN